MRRAGTDSRLKRLVALGALLLLAGFAVAGPTGLLAWSENAAALKARQTEIAQLTGERDGLRNRVKLLDPAAADPDLASQLVREHLGVMREDEVVLTLEEDAPKDGAIEGQTEPEDAAQP
jgi:cell division protein FtsB